MTRHEAFRQARQDRGVTRREAAYRAGVPYNSVTKAELGQYPSVLERLIDYFRPIWKFEPPESSPDEASVGPAKKFKQARIHFRYLRKDIQEELSLSYAQVHQAEHGLNHGALLRMIDHYAMEWGIPEDWFYDGYPSEVPLSVSRGILGRTVPGSEEIRTSDNVRTVTVAFWDTQVNLLYEDSFFSRNPDKYGQIPALFLDESAYNFLLIQVAGPHLGSIASSGDHLLVKSAPSWAPDVISIIRLSSGRCVCRIVRATPNGPFALVHPGTGQIEHTDHGWVIIGDVVAIFHKSVDPPHANIAWDMYRPLKMPRK